VRHHLFHYDKWSDSVVRDGFVAWAKSASRTSIGLNEADGGARGATSSGLSALDALKSHVVKVLERARPRRRATSRSTATSHEGARREAGRIIGETLEMLLEVVTSDPRRTSARHSSPSHRDYIAQKKS